MATFNRYLLWVLGIAALIGVFYYFGDIVSYILIAWVLSMLGRPLMLFYRRRIHIGSWYMGQSGAALLTMLTFLLVLAGFLMIFVPTIVQQARNFGTLDYAALGEKLKLAFTWMDQQGHRYGLLSDGETLGSRAQDAASAWFRPALLGTYLGTVISSFGNILVTITIVFFILFFFLKDSDLFLRMLYALVPNDMELKVRQAVRRSAEILTRYFGGLLLQVVSFATMVTIPLWIMGVPNALLIGIFGGIMNVVPYVGPIIGGAFGCFIVLSSNLQEDFSTLLPLVLKVLGSFIFAQLIDNNFLGPLIFSKSIRAHPLEIFIVTLIAAKIGGVLGMVLGIPVYTVLRIIGDIFFSEFKIVQRLTEHMDEDADTGAAL